MSSRWPQVVDYLVARLPDLAGWSSVSVYDTDPVTQDASASYAIVGRTADNGSSGSVVRQLAPSLLVAESGVVLVQIVTRTGSVDPVGMRTAGFALVGALEDLLFADQTLGGVLGAAGVVSLSVDVQSVANAQGVAQSLIVSISYTALV